MGLPRRDGYEVARRARAMHGGTDVVLVVLTGWGQAADKRRAVAAGFDQHLTKPVEAASLAALVSAATRHQ